MISRRRHAAALALLEHQLTLQHGLELARVRSEDVRTAQRSAVALVGVWLEGRAAGYRADADGQPSMPKSGPLNDTERRAIAHELEVCARDVRTVQIP